MKEYEIYLPLFYNDGTSIEARKFTELKERLLEQFGGVTYFPQPNEGLWRLGEVTYRDEIVIYRILTNKVRMARTFLRRLKSELEESFDQELILVVERDVETL